MSADFSISSTNCVAFNAAAETASLPDWTLSNISLVNAPLGVTALTTLPSNLFNGSLSKFLARGLFLAAPLTPAITPPIPAPINPLSMANLNLFDNLLLASSEPSSPSVVSNSVGPPITSPIVPKFWSKATDSPRVAPAIAPDAIPNLWAMLLGFASRASNFCSTFVLGLPNCLALPKLRYFPPFFASIAPFANLEPILKPTVPGIPIWTKPSVILPVRVFSAISSKGFMSSKKVSTSAA